MKPVSTMSPYGCGGTACFVLICCSLFLPAFGQDKRTARKPVLPRNIENDASFLHSYSLPDGWRDHPLAPAIEFAHTRRAHIRDNVRDFTCVLIKRERINGRLRNYEYLATRVRRQQNNGDRVVTPFSVYTQFLAPAKNKGRKVLYVEGRNNGKMLVRKGGLRFGYVTVQLSPDSDAAMSESRYPITQLGLERVAERLIEQALDDIRNDPTGANTEVTFYADAKVDNRPCTQIKVVHHEPGEKFGFHLAKIFVDDELHVPIRIAGYDWPRSDSDEPRLLEEYTYTRLKLNVGLTDSDFSPTLLEK